MKWEKVLCCALFIHFSCLCEFLVIGFDLFYATATAVCNETRGELAKTVINYYWYLIILGCKLSSPDNLYYFHYLFADFTVLSSILVE